VQAQAGHRPGHADQSLLYKAVADRVILQMPPGKPLPAAEIAIRAWIDGGASWDNAAAVSPHGGRSGRSCGCRFPPSPAARR